MRLLVSAASEHGATQEMAEAVAATLHAAGNDVDVVRPEDVMDVEPYAAFVLGSGVCAGSWLAPARDLAQR